MYQMIEGNTDIMSNNENNMTVVSCYWKINNRNGNKYDEWFKNSLKINQRYIFFCDENMNDYIYSFRNNYDTSFINYPFESLYSHKYEQDAWDNNEPHGTKASSVIWHEKINMMKIAKDYDVLHDNLTEFYIWIDSGISSYRDTEPPTTKLNLKDIHSIPRDKISYSVFDLRNIETFTAGCIIIHKDFIDYVHKIYYEKLILL
jgi:hypothetical protein